MVTSITSAVTAFGVKVRNPARREVRSWVSIARGRCLIGLGLRGAREGAGQFGRTNRRTSLRRCTTTWLGG